MILADTGFWVALIGPSDARHADAMAVRPRVGDEPLVTTWPVLTEACYLIERDNDIERVIAFLADVHAGACEVRDLPEDALSRIQTLMRKYRSRPMDLADASLVVLAEELNEGRILTTDDQDFETYRWKKTKTFHNLLLRS